MELKHARDIVVGNRNPAYKKLDKQTKRNRRAHADSKTETWYYGPLQPERFNHFKFQDFVHKIHMLKIVWLLVSQVKL